MSTDVFYEMPSDPNLYESQYDVKAGHWPENHNEVVLVLTGNGNISDFMLYTLGLRDANEFDDMVKKFAAEEEVTTPDNIEQPPTTTSWASRSSWCRPRTTTCTTTSSTCGKTRRTTPTTCATW